ncbi:MAG: transposase [Kiritimatiellae bacterium]|nr:transposase [Kiritimatiellia bacterium]
MGLWSVWWSCVERLRPAFSRSRTFLWFALALAAACVRPDLAGVTSLVRSLGLEPACYGCLLRLFHSTGFDAERLARLWTQSALALLHRQLWQAGGRTVFLADGIKIPKTGRKMPAVKKLHQESESNTKPEYIFGHSCQVIALAVRAARGCFALPLAGGIHEGVVFSNRDRRTLLDKLAAMLLALEVSTPGLLVADAYYASAKIILPLLRAGWHLIAGVRFNAVAYLPPEPPVPGRRGCRRRYGAKVHLRTCFEEDDAFTEAPSPVYGETGIALRYRALDLLWRPVGIVVRFVLVAHPTRGRKILLSTDRSLPPLTVIQTYGIRFKIEVSFKQAIHTLGTYAYHFWMSIMKPRPRRSGNQHLHMESEHYRNAVRRKLRAYHAHIQLGIVAQGLLQALAVLEPAAVWRHYGSWLRTIRIGVPPSERVVALALRNTLPQFLADTARTAILAKFIRKRIDPGRAEGLKLAS